MSKANRTMATTAQQNDEALNIGAKLKNALVGLDKSLRARDATGTASALDAIQRALDSAGAGVAKGEPGGQVAGVAGMVKVVQAIRSAARDAQWTETARLVNVLRSKMNMAEVDKYRYAYGKPLSAGVVELLEAAEAAQAELDEIEQRKDDWAEKERASWGKHPVRTDERTLSEQRVDAAKDAVNRRWQSGGTLPPSERNTLLERCQAIGLGGLSELRDLAGSVGQMESKLAELEREHEQRLLREKAQDEVNDKHPSNPLFGA